MPAVLYGASKDLVSRVLHVRVLDVSDPEAKDEPPVTTTIPIVSVVSNKPSHGRNFETVIWKGEFYALRPMQRPIIKLLWEARQTPHKFVSGVDLLEAAGTDQAKVSDLFKEHPAWMNLIVPGSKRGGPPDTYCLAD